ncbi:MAG: ATP-binding protein [Myxococcota bacterium]
MNLAVATEALDRWLERVCDAERRRAERLHDGVQAGWDAVRAQLAPALDTLAEEPSAALPLPDAIARLPLAPLDREVLWILLAPWLEPRYGAVYRVLQDDLTERGVTERLLVRVLGRGPAVMARLLADAPLLEGGWVQAGLSAGPLTRPFEVAPEVRVALLGGPVPARFEGAPVEAPGEARGPAPEWQVRHGLSPWVVPDGALRVAPTRLDRAALLRAWRLAIAHDRALELDLGRLSTAEAEALALEAWSLAAVMGTAVRLRTPEPVPLPVLHQGLAAAAWPARRDAWRALGQGEAAAGRLAGWRLDPGEITALGARLPTADEPELHDTAARLLAVPIPHGRRVSPLRSLDDLVLRAETREALGRLAWFLRERDRLAALDGLEARFRLRRGPLILFSGRSGTGKTVAAEGVARAAQRPLVVVDLSRLVSKYIGETEKNIDTILSAAERSGVVLFFDEADALFAQRTEVSSSNDRFANLEVGYLLQRVEVHEGPVILATNLRQTIDEAFLRRMSYRIEFPLPDAEERAALWAAMVGEREGVSLGALAQRHRLAGGDIRNASLKAMLLAEQEQSPLTTNHLERAVQLELLELGRLARRENAPSDRGPALRAQLVRLEQTLEASLKARFPREVHLLHGSPTREALAGRRPAVSLSVFRMAHATAALKVGIIVSAWSQRAEEENELLAAAAAALADARSWLRVQESHDFELLHRFWSSHGQPIRASLVVDLEVAEEP